MERGGQWVKGKSCDTFAPVAPFVATKDELRDPGNLKMCRKVHGEIRQNSSTANMIVGVPTLVSYASEFMTLLLGDVISTGTPAGVGLGMKPPQYLKAGDVVELRRSRGIAAACEGLFGTESFSDRVIESFVEWGSIFHSLPEPVGQMIQTPYMRIDSHQHFWRYDVEDCNWIDDSSHNCDVISWRRIGN